MKAYSNDIRERVIKALQEGEKVKEISERLTVSTRFIYSLSMRFRCTGCYEALKHSGGAPRKLSEEDNEKIRQAIRARPDITLAEIQERCNLQVSVPTIHRAIKRMGLTRKKNTLCKRTKHASSTDTKETVDIFNLDKLVFLDESSINLDMTRLYARGPKGERVYDYVSDTRWKAMSVISSLRLSGQTECLVYKNSLTGDFFKQWLKEALCPTLHRGDVLVMDNLSCHKVKGVQELIEQAGAQLRYLPPYSPDLNPIEKMWSKIKTVLRELKARTEECLFAAIGQAFSRVTKRDAQGWFNSCGYCLQL